MHRELKCCGGAGLEFYARRCEGAVISAVEASNVEETVSAIHK